MWIKHLDWGTEPKASQDGDLISRQIFTVKLWREHLGAGQYEWRGRIEHIESGEVRYFREETALLQWLREHFAGSNIIESIPSEKRKFHETGGPARSHHLEKESGQDGYE